jgi:GTPase SAR1 family protein
MKKICSEVRILQRIMSATTGPAETAAKKKQDKKKHRKESKKDRAGVGRDNLLSVTALEADELAQMPTHTAKVLIIGEEGVGKSSFVRRLLNDENAIKTPDKSLHIGDFETTSKVVAVATNDMEAPPLVPLKEGEMSSISAMSGATGLVGPSKSRVRLDFTMLTPTPAWRTIVASHYRGCAAAIFIYDPSKIDSFNDLPQYMDDVKQTMAANPVVFFVIATSSADVPTGYGDDEEEGHRDPEREKDVDEDDESETAQRTPVKTSKGRKLAEKHGCGFLDMSVMKTDEVDSLLARLAATIMQVHRQGKPIIVTRINPDVLESEKQKDHKVKPSKKGWCCTCASSG